MNIHVYPGQSYLKGDLIQLQLYLVICLRSHSPSHPSRLHHASLIIWPDWASLTSSVETRYLGSVEAFMRCPWFVCVPLWAKRLEFTTHYSNYSTNWPGWEPKCLQSPVASCPVLPSFLDLFSQERHASWGTGTDMKEMHPLLWLCVLSHPQGLNSPLWQQQASRPLSASARLCGSEVPPARADATFKVTMVPGDGVGPELMTAVKEVFKVHFSMVEMESPVSFWHHKIHDELKSWIRENTQKTVFITEI